MPKFYGLFDFVKDVGFEKKNLFKDPEAEKDYPIFMMNRIFGGFLDTILYVQQLNIRPQLDRKMHYDYLFHALKPRKRFNKKLEVEENLNISKVMKYYNYNRARATEVLPLITDEKLAQIDESMNQGGK